MRAVLLFGKRGHGLVSLVDDSDYETIASHRWYVDRDGYPVASVRHAGKRSTITIHGLLIGIVPGMFADHIDGDRLNNQRSNLRHCTPSQSSMNRARPSHNTTGVRNVSLHRSGKYKVHVQANGECRYFGLYDTLAAASVAANAARTALHREYARMH